MIVLDWFHSVLHHVEKDLPKESVCYYIAINFVCLESLNCVQKCDRHTRALILTIAVCYYAKLQHREDFEEYIAPRLMINTPNAPKIFREEIQR